MRLSDRMRMVASMVTEGKVLADIGCDHGYLSIWLVRNGIVSRAIAMDVREGPLERAAANIRFFHQQERIETRLSDGMDELAPKEADRIVIAGMGGILMRDILLRGRACAEAAGQMVLQPQSDIGLVREAVHSLGYRIADEQACREGGKYYIAFACVKGSEEVPYTGAEYRYGRILVNRRDETWLAYLREELGKKERMIERIRVKDPECSGRRASEITAEIAELKGILNSKKQER